MDEKDRAFVERLLATFRVEAAEHVRAVSHGLIAIEKTTASGEQHALIETIFREVHSLKGAARAVNQESIEMLCQSIEDIFAALKQQKLSVSTALLDLLHHAVDELDKLLLVVGERRGTTPKSSVVTSLRQRLDAMLTSPPAQPDSTPVDDSANAGGQDVSHRPIAAAHHTDTLRVSARKLDSMLLQVEGLVANKLTATQQALELREIKTTFLTLLKERSKIAPDLRAIHRSVALDDREPAHSPTSRSLRRLLDYMTWEDAFARSLEHKLHSVCAAATHETRALGAKVTTLLDDMKHAMMLPVSIALEALPKLVRDLARDQNKQVELTIEGGEIEADRRILDELRDPLVHLVRNCLDHGIERPEDRQRRGKPAVGTIAVSIRRDDVGRMDIAISDDGTGIDLAKVREAAERMGAPIGATTPEDAALVFRSGVSTSPLITDISGRGLGLAIVRDKVENLGGTIHVTTRPNEGTAFQIALPITLTTYRGLHVRAAGQSFVLPAAYVERVTRVRRDDIKTVENRETISWNGDLVAFTRLAEVLQVTPTKQRNDGIASVVIVRAGGFRMAFEVDDVYGEQDILLKSLGKQLLRVRNLAGATILGSGQIVPVINVSDLMRSAIRVGTARPAVAEAAQTRGQRSILVVEDSVTSRMLLKNILESAGYRVGTAVDGVEAYMLLRTSPFDLVVSDVDMPRMSGFDLVAKIRGDKKLSELPIVLVTALASREHRERGIEVGANAYLVKNDFEQSNLLETVRRLL